MRFDAEGMAALKPDAEQGVFPRAAFESHEFDVPWNEANHSALYFAHRDWPFQALQVNHGADMGCVVIIGAWRQDAVAIVSRLVKVDEALASRFGVQTG